MTKRRQSAKAAQPSSDDSSASDYPSKRKKVRWFASAQINSTATEEETSSGDEEPPEKGSTFLPSLSLRTCLAALCSHGKVGCAYYEPVKRILFVMEDTRETPHFDMMNMLLEQVNPDIALTSSKADDDFINVLTEHMETTSGVFQIRPFKEFVPAKGRDRLLALNRFAYISTDDNDLPPSSEDASSSSRPRNAYDFMQSRREVTGDPTTMRWNASIRLANFASVESSPLCLASIGALLDYIVREKALSEFDDDGIGGLDIRDIEIIALDAAMQINADALLSLQVFENESHASVHSDKTKEGLSLFSILNRTNTALGRSLLRTWLLRPSLSIPTIEARHDAVECFMLSENVTTSLTIHNHLKGIKNMPRIMGLLKDGKGKLADWQGLVKFTFHATMLRDSVSELHQASKVEVLRKLISALDIPAFRDIGIRTNEIIDWEESAVHERVCVRPNIDEDLDNRKHIYHGIDSVLSTVAEQLSETVPPTFASTLNVVYFPQLGYLICVPMLDEWRTEAGVQPLEGWTFQFSSDSNVYFKSEEMHDMDTHIGDLHSTIVDRELEIIQELLETVLVSQPSISAACDVCAELDCLLSFAEASRIFEYRRPQMVEENIIDIVQGRHPLHERVVDTFVANDARLIGGAGIGVDPDFPDSDEWNSVLLCTGANACGKSVYLKQIALMQIMAQIGCFVPADSAKLGIVDKIFTRVSTRESVSKVQSAFMIDLAQVSLALRNCTARSLVILDEFGKGTLSTGSSSFLDSWLRYGAGIFCGVLRHLLNRGVNCPKVLIATHFHDLFNEDLLDPQAVPVSFRHMQVMFTSSTGAELESSALHNTHAGRDTSPTSVSRDEDMNSVRVGPTEKITYLYRVAEGLSLESHAAKCAEIFGVPTRIVKRAQYVTNLLSTHKLNLLLDEGMTEAERLELEDAEAVCRRFLAWDLKADAEQELGEGYVKRKLGEVLGRVEEEEG
ncbi:hypothetical protein CPC08DRAFT_744416 [Agrocybe pediades]|nr:hypothetical protein CPC08DRAFT_744416 [Agrocybe pediades]